ARPELERADPGVRPRGSRGVPPVASRRARRPRRRGLGARSAALLAEGLSAARGSLVPGAPLRALVRVAGLDALHPLASRGPDRRRPTRGGRPPPLPAARTGRARRR